MAFKTTVRPHQACVHAPESSPSRHFVCDAEADLPASGLNAGDTAYAITEDTKWRRKTSTTWARDNGKAQLGFGGLIGALTQAMTRWGNGASVALTVDDLSSQIEVTSPGTLKNLRVTVGTAPGVGNTITYTVRINGTTDSALTCSISGTNTSAQDTTHEVSVNAGDKIEIKVTVGAGTPINVATRAEVEIDY